jgi:hypothetical protein
MTPPTGAADDVWLGTDATPDVALRRRTPGPIEHTLAVHRCAHMLTCVRSSMPSLRIAASHKGPTPRCANGSITSVYVDAAADEVYVAEKYRVQLGKVRVGKSSVSFRGLADADLKRLLPIVGLASKQL